MQPRAVLVVEDDADCAEVIAEALRCVGHEVAIASDPASATAALALRRPDVVFVDCHLGAADGIELVQRLRSGALQGVPVILTTGRTRAEVARAAHAAGIERVLVKPLDLELLLDAVMRVEPQRRAASSFQR